MEHLNNTYAVPLTRLGFILRTVLIDASFQAQPIWSEESSFPYPTWQPIGLGE